MHNTSLVIAANPDGMAVVLEPKCFPGFPHVHSWKLQVLRPQAGNGHRFQKGKFPGLDSRHLEIGDILLTPAEFAELEKNLATAKTRFDPFWQRYVPEHVFLPGHFALQPTYFWVFDPDSGKPGYRVALQVSRTNISVIRQPDWKKVLIHEPIFPWLQMTFQAVRTANSRLPQLVLHPKKNPDPVDTGLALQIWRGPDLSVTLTAVVKRHTPGNIKPAQYALWEWQLFPDEETVRKTPGVPDHVRHWYHVTEIAVAQANLYAGALRGKFGSF